MNINRSPSPIITEMPNELTRDIDLASPAGIVDRLSQSDEQIINGYAHYPSLSDPKIHSLIDKCIERVFDLLRFKGNAKIIIAGAGTSGRLAAFICRQSNKILVRAGNRLIFQHLIAGGNTALIKAKEGAEDDPLLGVRDLQQSLRGVAEALYIGISCGLSAPYIARQLDYCMDLNHVKTILIGFNPANQARNTKIENWNLTFRQVVKRMSAHPRSIILNPIVGPEPIAGSTRMKAGSATKLLLDVILSLGIIRSKILPTESYRLPYDIENPLDNIRRVIDQYEQTRLMTYHHQDSIAHLVKLGGNALRSKRHIYYLGKRSFGILGLIDASECPPTFGSEFGDVQGFLEGGWNSFLGENKDDGYLGPEHRFKLDDFCRHIVPRLAPDDLVIGLCDGNQTEWVDPYLGLVIPKGAAAVKIVIRRSGENIDQSNASLDIQLEQDELIPNYLAFSELALKLIINALSTGANILAGKVYENRMIDLKISNSKLYSRSLLLVQDLMKVNEATARESLVRSIYGVDKPNEDQLNATISTHISKSQNSQKIIPQALLLATGKFNMEQATEALIKNPIVRSVINDYIKH